MKTFTATHLNKHAQEVFAAVDKDGWVTIKHDRYPENDIILMRRIKTAEALNVCGKCMEVRPKTESGISDCCESFFITMPKENYEQL